ncbi:MAG TPA: carbonic anhydrase [Nocardioidaceae bacterium]
MSHDFDDILRANRRYAESFDLAGLSGKAAAGIAVVTCMDVRVDPLPMLGLRPGDANVIRNPGGRVTPQVLEALVLATNLLGVRRIVVVEHTRCAVAGSTEAAVRQKVAEASGMDCAWQPFLVAGDQKTALTQDVAAVRSHPLIADGVEVGGFLYDVETGLVEQLV